jgi:hypothetical protein
MVVTLELAPEVEQRIIAQAASHGVSLDTYLIQSARTPSLADEILLALSGRLAKPKSGKSGPICYRPAAQKIAFRTTVV